MAIKAKFTTVDAAQRLLESMEIAINNMIEEIKKPVDPDINGSARKAELQSIKQTAVYARELIQERQKLEEMVRTLRETGGIEEDRDFKAGFAERNAKR